MDPYGIGLSGQGPSERARAVIIGALFIVGTVAGGLSAVVTGPVLSSSDYLASVAAQPGRMIAGSLLVLVMIFTLSLVPVLFYPVGRRYSQTLAMGYLLFRGALEAILPLLGVVGWLLLVALSRQPGTAAEPIAEAVKLGNGVLWEQLNAIPFVLGALMFYSLLFASKLLPRWLSFWGLAGAALYLGAPMARMFGRDLDLLMGPLALQEMVMAIWLIVKGFEPVERRAKVKSGGPGQAREGGTAR